MEPFQYEEGEQRSISLIADVKFIYTQDTLYQYGTPFEDFSSLIKNPFLIDMTIGYLESAMLKGQVPNQYTNRYGFDSENASVTSANSFKLNLLADTVSVSMNITLISTEETSSSINVTNENKTCNLTVTEKSLTKETCKEQEDLYGDYDDVFKMTMNYDEATPCLQEMLAKTIAASMQKNSILYKKAAEERKSFHSYFRQMLKRKR